MLSDNDSNNNIAIIIVTIIIIRMTDRTRFVGQYTMFKKINMEVGVMIDIY